MALHRRQITYSERPNHAARSAHAKGDRAFRTYDTSYIRPKRSPVPTIVAIIIAVIIIVIAAFWLRSCMTPTATLIPSSEEAVVTIEQGESAQAIGQSLMDAGLVRTADAFVDEVVNMGAETALIPGTYTIPGGTSLQEIIGILKIGPAATGDTLTISEGLTREQTAAAVSQATDGRISEKAFLDSSSNAALWAPEFPFLESAGTNSLEGFLFPKTYIVTATDRAEQVVRMMLNQFQTETANLSWAYPESAGLSIYEAVTLASIVEKETHVDNRPTIASVFYNRLSSSRPYLESDATTAYEVGHDPTPEEVHANTPYSTYTNQGLPPTPICSPSLESLQAVCNPADTDYMFFYYTSQDGIDNYYFSETYEEHQEAISNG